PAFAQRYRHRALMVCHRRSIWPTQLPGAAKRASADVWARAPEFGRRFIEKGDQAIGVSHIDRFRQGLQQGLDGNCGFARPRGSTTKQHRIVAQWQISHVVLPDGPTESAELP